MAEKQGLTQTQRQTMRLSQSQVRFVRALEMSAPEFDEAVKREVEENPALEASYDETGADSQKDNEASDSNRDDNGNDRDDNGDIPATGARTKRQEFFPSADTAESLYEVLERQIDTLSITEDEKNAAKYIVGNLDSNGYLTRDLQAIANDLLFSENIDLSEEVMMQGLLIVQGLEPHGVGAKSLQECLLLQLRPLLEHTVNASQRQIIEYATTIVERHFDLLALRHTHKLQAALHINEETLKAAMEVILRLNPKPGAAYGGAPSQFNYVVPDFIVSIDDGEITLTLNNSFPELIIEKSFSQAMREMSEHRKQRKGSEFVVSRFNDAREFIKIIQRRQDTLQTVMTAIIALQKEYFLTEDESKLKPMGLKDIGEMTGYDLSVVSRSTKNKYVSLPWGILPLRFFFSEAFGNEGEDAASGREIETAIRKLVEEEDKRHPLSDDAICKALTKDGYEVSRRTINKYRERLGIPVSRLRKLH
jgi:RNA polymerase sigma-54 factor